jgi:hypothetical protein
MYDPVQVGDQRFKIADWMVLVLALAICLAIFVARDFSTFVIIAIVLAANWWLTQPRRLREIVQLGLGPIVERCDFENSVIPDTVKARARVTIPRVEALGFALYGHLSVRGAERDVPFFHTVFLNRESSQRAGLISTSRGTSDLSYITSFFYFSTEFADLTRLETGVGDMMRLFTQTRTRAGSLRLARVESLERLYQIHKASLAHFAANEPARWDENESVEGRLQAHAIRNVIDQAKAGHYWFDPDLGVFRLTWRGAILVTWNLRVPGRQIRLRSARSKAARVLREIGVPSGWKPS